MIQCNLLPVREYEHIPFLNKTNKTKFGHYQPMFFSIKGYGRACWVVASRIKVEEECGDKTDDEIIAGCIEYLNTPPKSKYGKRRKRKPLYGTFRAMPHSYKMRDDYIQALLIVEDKKNKNFWGKGRDYTAYSCLRNKQKYI